MWRRFFELKFKYFIVCFVQTPSELLYLYLLRFYLRAKLFNLTRESGRLKRRIEVANLTLRCLTLLSEQDERPLDLSGLGAPSDQHVDPVDDGNEAHRSS